MDSTSIPDLEGALFNAFGPAGTRDAAARLLAAGAKATFKQKGQGGWTVRMQAYRYQRDALDLLLGYPFANLFDAAIDGDVSAVRSLVDEGASLNELDCYGHCSALTYAAGLGHVKVVALLLSLGARPNPAKKTAWSSPLVAALLRGHLDCADLLWMTKGRGDAADLMYEVVNGNAPVTALDWVLKHEPDGDLQSALRIAAKGKRLEILAWLIRVGADVNQPPSHETCLMIAAFYQCTDSMQMLLEAGADPHATNADGQTAMHYALCCNHIHDPDDVFDYGPADLEKESVKLLQRAGLAIPPPRA